MRIAYRQAAIMPSQAASAKYTMESSSFQRSELEVWLGIHPKEVSQREATSQASVQYFHAECLF